MKEKATGARVLADMLNGYGVTHVFMVPAVLRQTMVELEKRTTIARIHTHGEKSAAYMADGYARTSGRPGVCMAQVIGALNLAAGLRDAWLAHSPVIAMTGGRLPESKFRKVYQEVDDLPGFDNVTKLNATVDAVVRIPDMVRQAFRTAVSGTPGPVHLQFQGNEGQLDQAEGDLDGYVDEIFRSIPPFRPRPDDNDLLRLLEAIRDAERPVIVAGGGVRASGASQELLAFAERWSVPVATSLNGKDSIQGGHPLAVGVVGTYSRAAANVTVGEADLVFFLGTETGSMTTNFWQVPTPGVRALQLDIEAESLGRNYELSVAVLGDAKASLARLVQLSPAETPDRSAWLERVRKICDAWKREYEPLLRSDAVPIRPERICSELTDNVPDNGIVVVDTGHGGMWMGGMYDLRSPNQRYMRSAGHLGWAFPAAMGAKCAAPDRPVICFTGDGGLWYHLSEIETAVRWGINTVTVVNNNRSGNQSQRGFDRVYGGTQTAEGRRLWTFSDVDFARIANDMGAVGIRVEKPSEIGPALRKAIEIDSPVIVDVATDIDALAPLAVVAGT